MVKRTMWSQVHLDYKYFVTYINRWSKGPHGNVHLDYKYFVTYINQWSKGPHIL